MLGCKYAIVCKKDVKQHMKLSYNKLWKLLIDSGIKKGELRERARISQSTMAKLAKNQNVTTEILLKICSVLKCNIGDIVEVVCENDI